MVIFLFSDAVHPLPQLQWKPGLYGQTEEARGASGHHHASGQGTQAHVQDTLISQGW